MAASAARLACASTSATSARLATARPASRSNVAEATRAMSRNPIRLPRKAATATSLAALRMVGAAPPAAKTSRAILSAGNWRSWQKEERGQRSLPRTVVRLLLPFYRPKEWKKLAVQAPYILKEISSFAAVLRKAGEAEECAA